MMTSALWTTILSFAALTSSIGLTLVVRGRRRTAWFDWYAVYAAGYALWAIVYSFTFFVAVYETSPSPAVGAVVAWIRALLSGAVMLSLWMVAAGIRAGAAAGKRRTIVAVVLGALFLGTGIGGRFVPSYVVLVSINIAYNLILLWCAALILMDLRKIDERMMKSILFPVVSVAVVFYLFASATGIVLLFRETQTPALSAFAISGYLLPWAAVAIATQSRVLKGGNETDALERFAEAHGLTPRERDIVRSIASGMSNAGAAEAQFVSVRTVETHLSNVYQKAGLRSRTELLSALRDFT